MAVPAYTPEEARARAAFLALMWALSYPGRRFNLPDTDDPFTLIGETLLDLETSYYTPSPALDVALARTGARRLSPDTAAYHFYPTPGEIDPAVLESANPGSTVYPDEGATLILAATLDSGTSLTLTGPGILSQAMLQVDGLPTSLWSLRARHRYPLGWDLFLVDRNSVVGLPRSTRILLA